MQRFSYNEVTLKKKEQISHLSVLHVSLWSQRAQSSAEARVVFLTAAPGTMQAGRQQQSCSRRHPQQLAVQQTTEQREKATHKKETMFVLFNVFV